MSRDREFNLGKISPVDFKNPHRRNFLVHAGGFLGLSLINATNIAMGSINYSYQPSTIDAEKYSYQGVRSIPYWILLTLGLGLCGSLSYIPILVHYRQKYKNYTDKFTKELGGVALIHHPDWRQTPPTKGQITSVQEGLCLLPPIGGKVDESGKSGPLVGKLIPTRAAETSTKTVIDHIKQYPSGQKLIYQISVQGRLPDRFKYAALALIITNPAELDWNNPYFEAPWGKMAPMIHDGGIVNENVNLLWKNVDGRTDFLFQLTAFEPDLDSLEQLSPSQIAQLTQEQLTAALRERKLREYLGFAARFYQRIALACHAVSGSLPETVPPNLRKSLTKHWYFFKDNLQDLLDSCNLREVTQSVWFLDQPRNLANWHQLRYEADWPPIREELIRIEQARMKTPEISYQTIRLMKVVTNSIDREIGILTSSESL